MSENEKKQEPAAQPCWYVMTHLNPQMIEKFLQEENEECRRCNLPPYEYFIPYLFLNQAMPEQWTEDAAEQAVDAEEANRMRSDLHRFVFIKTTSKGIIRLSERPWNKEGRLHLRFYRSKYGRNITVPENMMSPFITLCCEKRQQFSFGPPVTDVSEDDVVIIRDGLFKDFPATVLKVKHSAEGIRMTLGIPMFDGTKTLRLSGYKTDDVRMSRGTEKLLSVNFIDNVEDELLDILRRRVKHRETDETRRNDATLLDRLYHYSYIQVREAPARNRFRALMLICATLRKDLIGRDSLIRELQDMLSDTEAPSDDEQAYLMAALYIATGNADYRTVVKTYRRQHPDCSQYLQMLLPLITRMRFR